MTKYLFLGEKPSLTKEAEKVYKKNISKINSELGEVSFMSLSGHMCRLIQPKEYDAWNCKWKDIELPMIPKTFKIDSLNSDREKTLKEIGKAVKDKKYDAIIVGTDPDVEGNGIYYLVENYLGITKFPAYRFWYDDMTEPALLKAFLTLTDFHKNPRDIRMTDAYLIRSRADWLVGMNFTTGMTVKTGSIMKVGRVKAPTLKLVYDNCKAIDGFVKKTDYELDAVYKEGFTGTYVEENEKQLSPVRFQTEKEALDFAKDLSNTAKVISIKKTTTNTQAPELYKLSTAQSDIGAKYGYSPARTLELIQSLYEKHKLVTYPRTDGAYVSTETAKTFGDLLNNIKVLPELSPFVSSISPADIAKTSKNKKYVNDEEVGKASHDALLPTKTKPDISKLTEEEKNVYLMICKKLISIFMPPLSEEKTVIITENKDCKFKTNGKKVLNKGWTVIFDKKIEDNLVPELKEGQIVNVSEFKGTEKNTTPPTRFTQVTLNAAMENVHKYVSNKEYKDILKETSGLGMPSSRSQIITDLLTTGYMEEKGKGKGLYITPLGTAYVENLLGMTVVDPIMTAQWEEKMKLIRDGAMKYEDVEKEIIDYVKETVKEIDSKKIEKVYTSSGPDIECPYCGKRMIKGKFGYFCEGKPKGDCTFAVGETVASKKLTDKQMTDIITKGSTGVIKGFKSKEGKSFDASLERTEKGVKFVFDTKKTPKKAKK